MKIIDVLNLDAAIEQLENVQGMSFSYALMKNKKIFKQERDTLSHVLPEIPGYKEYVNEVNKLVKEYCVAKPDVKVFVPDQLEMLEGKDQKEFLEGLGDLQTQNQSLLIAKRDQLKEYNDFLQQQINIDFYRINQSYLPKQTTFQELYPLVDLINFTGIADKPIEISKYEIFTYLDLFEMNPSRPGLRDKLLQNALILKQASSDLLSDPIVVAWQVYEKQRKQLAESFAEKDIYGDVLLVGSKNSVGNQYYIKNKDEFQNALTKLNAEFEAELTAFYALLAEKQTLNVVSINEEDLPEDLSLKELKSLDLFLS